MTFSPIVLPQYDTKNSASGTGVTYTGTSASNNGYLAVNLDITSTKNTVPSGILIQISVDNVNFVNYFVDTYFTNTTYQKTINITGKYYKLSVTFASSANYTIYTYLNTNFDQAVNNGIYVAPSVDAHYDAFGKLRVSNPFTLIDLKFPPSNTGDVDYLKNNLQMLYNNTTGGTTAYGNSQAVLTQTGAGTSTSQSRKYCIYQPGKSLLCLASFVFNKSTSTSTSLDYALRVGYFDDYNGVFLQYNKSDTTVAFVLRSNIIGTFSQANDTVYNQAVWNVDRLDGTGNTGILVDFEKAQLLVIDLEWLSVGRLRFGFMVFGKVVYCHKINNLNELSGPYMYTANLPIRYQVVNNTTGTAVLTQICSTVISEGGYRPSVNLFSIASPRQTILPTNEYSVLVLTGNQNYYHNEVVIRSVSIYVSTSDTIKYRVRLYLPEDSPGTFSYTDVATTSVVEYATPNSITVAGSSTVLDQGYVLSKSSIVSTENVSDVIINNNSITSSINNGTIGWIVLTLQSVSVSGSYDAAVSFNWSEF